MYISVSVKFPIIFFWKLKSEYTVKNLFFTGNFLTHTRMCVCVCVCVQLDSSFSIEYVWLNNKDTFLGVFFNISKIIRLMSSASQFNPSAFM